MVSDAAATKAPIAKIADKVSGVFVPAVMGIALVTFVVWLLLGRTVGYALARGISVLVISCPCALGLATPVAIMVGSGMGAKNGILFKTAASLEETGRIQIVALDKTGTITSGDPTVTDLCPAPGVTEMELLRLAFPRRVFTLSQTEYVIDRVKWLYDHRDLVGGLRFVHEPATLRFFTGVLEPIGDWPERLAAAYRADFGDEQ